MSTHPNRSRWILALAVLAVASAAACSSPPKAKPPVKAEPKPPTADDRLAQARAADKAGDLDAAVSEYRAAHSMRAGHFETLDEMTGVLLRLAQPAEAVEITKAYFDANPGDPRGYTLHARALTGAGSFAMAEGVFTQLLELDANDAAAYNGRARARVMQKKMPEAVSDARKSIELSPQTVKFHIDLGSILNSSGNLGEAAIALRGAIQLNPDNGRAHLLLGVVLRENYEVKEALSHHLKATRLTPKNDRAHFELGLTYFRMQDSLGAEAALEQAVNLQPKDATNWYAYGQILRALEKYDDAHDAYRKVLELDPKHPKAYRKLGFVLYKSGKLAEAEVLLTAALRQTPDDPYVYWDLGQVYRSANKLKLAVEAYERFLEKADPSEGDVPKAKKHIRRLKKKLRRRR